jgi:hypothetical protein
VAFWLAVSLPAARADVGGAPVLTVLATAGDDAGRTRERRFVEELGLALDEFRVVSAAAPTPDFIAAPSAERLAAIRRLATERGGAATIWIEDSPEGTTLLHLVALQAGRWLVKMVETPTGPGTEAELALAARELLGEAYLFGGGDAGEAVERVAEEVHEAVTPPGEEDERALRWSLVSQFAAAGGLAGHDGPSLQLGVVVAGEVALPSGLFFRLGGLFESGPSGDLPSGDLSGLGFGLDLGLGYGFALGDVRLGPLASVGLSWSRLEVTLARDDTQRFDAWSLRGALGLDLRWQATDFFALVIDGTAGVHSNNQKLTYTSDGSRGITTPRFDWQALAGLAVTF